MVRRNPDAHIVSASALVRGFRRRGRLALSGAARDPLILVSDLAGAPAALVENSTLIDAPPHRLKLAQIADKARNYDLAVLHTSAPSFASDVETIKALKAVNPALKAGFVGAKVAVDPAGSLKASPAIDFVARNEFDFTIKEIADGRSWSEIAGLSYRNAEGVIVQRSAAH
jgi:hypothetical protein